MHGEYVSLERAALRVSPMCIYSHDKHCQSSEPRGRTWAMAQCYDRTADIGTLACRIQERMCREGAGECQSSSRTSEPWASHTSTASQTLHNYPTDDVGSTFCTVPYNYKGWDAVKSTHIGTGDVPSAQSLDSDRAGMELLQW